MKCTCVLAFAISGSVAVTGQNLVPNGNFEEYTECPDYVVQVDRCVGWDRAAWSPDYFNACDTTIVAGVSNWVGVPENFVGFQPAYSGNGYMGMITYLDSTFLPDPEILREHIGTYLSEPLIPGTPVYISFRASATFGNGFNDRPKYVCSGLGIRFRHGPLDLFNPQASDNEAAVFMDEVLMDSLGWVLVRGSYVPDSAYDYLVIGNFFDRYHCEPTLVNEQANEGVAYSYVDDVCVSYDSSAYLTTDVHSGLEVAELHIAPNPCGSECRVHVNGQAPGRFRLGVFNPDGNAVPQSLLSAGEKDWLLNVRNLADGVYVIRIQSDVGISSALLIVQH